MGFRILHVHRRQTCVRLQSSQSMFECFTAAHEPSNNSFEADGYAAAQLQR
jgi:hypothetical protein